jgi:hypothetical protein
MTSGHVFKRPITDNLWNCKNASDNVTAPPNAD